MVGVRAIRSARADGARAARAVRVAGSSVRARLTPRAVRR